jgi:signal peptidase I
VDLRDGVVYVDGRPLAEPYTHGQPSLPIDVQMPVTVPAGDIWLMGDNRTNSDDSRYFGPVAASSVIGHVLCVYWPLNEVRSLTTQ